MSLHTAQPPPPPCPILSCPVLSDPIISYYILQWFALSCLVLSCLILSCLVLSCLVLSCLVLYLSNKHLVLVRIESPTLHLSSIPLHPFIILLQLLSPSVDGDHQDVRRATSWIIAKNHHRCGGCRRRHRFAGYRMRHHFVEHACLAA